MGKKLNRTTGSAPQSRHRATPRFLQRRVVAAIGLALVAGLGQAADKPAAKATMANSATSLSSGIGMRNIDTSVRAQDDFYEHVNGKWLKGVEIPADQSSWGSFVELSGTTLAQTRGLIEKAAASNPAAGTDARRIGDYYASFMDEARLEQLGVTPLKGELARIAAIKDRSELPALLAHLGRLNVGQPFDFGIHQDNKDSTRYVADIRQGGLGLPDRDYFLATDDARMAAARTRYLAYVEKMLAMAGDGNAAASARAAVGFEQAIATLHWTQVDSRDRVKLYNKVMLADLGKLAPGFDWPAWLAATGIAGKTDYVIVGQPSYLKGVVELGSRTPLETWKAYLSLRVLNTYAPFLSKNFVDEYFAMYGKTLSGSEEIEARWKRGVAAVQDAQGEALGKLYVAEYFPAERKARIETMVKNLLAAFRQSIDTLDWMSPVTKKEAQAKLAKFWHKIGYPDKWRDYSTLVVARDDLIGNVMRANAFENARNLNKLGQPVDRTDWTMTPQEINAYYNPEKNEIVFPAGMLQPPFFDAHADDAANYGAIGAVIGHEISHAFDDQGAQYDGDGNLHDWWTPADHKNFEARTRMLVDQFNVLEVMPGYRVNGALTLGENIADDSGLAVAYKAYKISLKGKNAPTIDGLSGAQRFYMGWAQAWRSKQREKYSLMLLKVDPHAPDRLRVNGMLRNEPEFYEAFGVKPGDRMYLAPKDRVLIW